MSKQIANLISETAKKCIKHKIALRLENTDTVYADNIPCSGFFDEKSLVVATDKKTELDWVFIFAHESCHLDQFLSSSKVWVSDEDCIDTVDRWINKKEKSRDKALLATQKTIALELDCEKRTIKKLARHGIRFNAEDYIQKANSYLFSYMYAFNNKKWYKQPYENKNVYKKMPKTFLKLNEYVTKYETYSQWYK